jgi:hypothetical protein
MQKEATLRHGCTPANVIRSNTFYTNTALNLYLQHEAIVRARPNHSHNRSKLPIHQ